jgi:hypothetical protein
MKHWRRWVPQLISLALTAQVVLGCGATAPASTPPPVSPSYVAPAPTSMLPSSSAPATTAVPSPSAAPTRRPTATDDLTLTPTDEEPGDHSRSPTDASATLGSLEQVDDYPLYTMRYYGAYSPEASSAEGPGWASTMASHAPACSLFAALGDAERRLYGRNFDWRYSPALLLFTDPPDGYASVSMVDIAYLIPGSEVHALTDLPVEAREPLLESPSWPFDGMNEHGLAVGMAAVPESEMPYDGNKETIDSLGVIREMLDHARNVGEAVAILERYNIVWDGGPALHYLIADASGQSMLVEFYAGEIVLVPGPAGKPWHLATNHLRTLIEEGEPSGCWRYDTIKRRLTAAKGSLPVRDALDLLADVAQENTQWSVVYDLSNGDVHVAMGQGYEEVHSLHLGRGNP